jgi:hypothetical protein
LRDDRLRCRRQFFSRIHRERRYAVTVQQDRRGLARHRFDLPRGCFERGRGGFPIRDQLGDGRCRFGTATLVDDLGDMALQIGDGIFGIADRVAESQSTILLTPHRGFGRRQCGIVGAIARKLARLPAMRGGAGLGGFAAFGQAIAARALLLELGFKVALPLYGGIGFGKERHRIKLQIKSDCSLGNPR